MILESPRDTPHIAAGMGSECIAKISNMDIYLFEMDIIRGARLRLHLQGSLDHTGSPDDDSPLEEWGEDIKV
jgi:hypothetical protein